MDANTGGVHTATPNKLHPECYTARVIRRYRRIRAEQEVARAAYAEATRVMNTEGVKLYTIICENGWSDEV